MEAGLSKLCLLKTVCKGREARAQTKGKSACCRGKGEGQSKSECTLHQNRENPEVIVQRKIVPVKVVGVVGDLKNIFSVTQISHSDTRVS